MLDNSIADTNITATNLHLEDDNELPEESCNLNSCTLLVTDLVRKLSYLVRVAIKSRKVGPDGIRHLGVSGHTLIMSQLLSDDTFNNNRLAERESK